jgi:hypothetical protein
MRKSPSTISAVGVFLIAFLAVVQAQNITTLAGGGPTGLSAKTSALGTPWAVVQDSTGNTYISDNLSNRVFKVDASGTLTVLAGNIVNNYNQGNHGDGQLANAAPLNAPEGIAVDSKGNVYIADTNNNAIRVVNTQSSSITLEGLTIPAGVIETIAGDGNGTACSPTTGPCGDGGPATLATLNGPGGVWLDTDGNVYIADTLDSRIRVVNMQASAITFYGGTSGVTAITVPPGNIQTIAGTGTAGFNNDGPAPTQKINLPDGIFVAGSAVSNTVVIVIADTINDRVRVVNTQPSLSASVAGVSILAGNIVTVAGDGVEGYMGDGFAATLAELNHPSAAVTDNLGNLYIADGDNLPPPQTVVTSNEVIREVNASNNVISTVVGDGTRCSNFTLPCGDGKAATSANLWAPTGVFLEGSGDLLIADQNDDAIREVVIGGDIQTVMGALLNTSYSPFPVTLTSAAADAELRRPAGVGSDVVGNTYIADTFNNAIRKVEADGTISTVVGNGNPCNTSNCGDGGPANSATVTTPFDVAFDNAGNLYIADSGDNLIRVVNNQATAIKIAGQTIAAGDILTVAGNGTPCASAPCGDGNPATNAELNSPEGLYVDPAGNIFIADTSDNAIRKVSVAGTITTVAGAANPNAACTNSLAGQCGDTGPATSALLNSPGGVGLDGTGNIYISDTGDNRVRVVGATSGIINAFAGTGVGCTSNCKNGGPALDALLDLPQNLFVDFSGNVFIADAFDFEVREVTKSDGNIQGVAGNETRGFSGDGGLATSAQLAVPFGVSGDPSGDLLIADIVEWRIRKVVGLVATPPSADLSKTSVSFPAQALNTKSASVPVTVSNAGHGANLTTTITVTGTDKSDFAETNNCASVPGPGSCTINITMTPAAAGALSAVLMITDNAPGSPQTINLSGTGEDFTLAKTGTLSNPSVAPGGSATATITITPGGGLAATVDLTCAITPATAVPPTCALSPTSLKPGTTKSTLTVTTVAATKALVAPSIVHRSAPFYAFWLLLPGMLLSTAGIGASRRRKLLSYFLIFCAIAGCLFLVACGGGGSSSGGGGTGGGTAGTTAGSYTVTVTAKTTTTTATQTLPLTVQ